MDTNQEINRQKKKPNPHETLAELASLLII
jgi:hypothetical protein